MDDYGCSCSIGVFGVGDFASVTSERVVVARKPHECCECGETIRPGDRYEVASGCWDGAWSRFSTCLPCMRIRDAFCCSWEYGRLVEVLLDELGFDYRTAGAPAGGEGGASHG
jgi:hypothetical protein